MIPVAEVEGVTNQLTTWSEHDPTIMASWKSLRLELRMFLYVVPSAIDILVEYFSSLSLTKVKSKRAESWTVGWREPDFLFTNVWKLKADKTTQEVFVLKGYNGIGCNRK